MMNGYSGTPLWKKLGYTPGTTAYLHDAPLEYAAWLEDGADGVDFADTLDAPVDLIHAFVTARAELEANWPIWQAALADGGMLWISWPKKASKVPTDITEDVLREVGLPRGLVDVKVCAVSAVWSGLKFVRRKAAP
jgi:hypothetical protein